MPTLAKDERLCSPKQIDALFHDGHRFMVFPYSVTWRAEEGPWERPAPCQVLITAPKRKLRHAVDRNCAKRHSRELFRLHKPALYDALLSRNLRIHLSISYIHTEVLPHDVLQRKFSKLISTLLKEVEG